MAHGTILLIGHDADSATILSLMLEGRGFDIVHFRSLDEALAVAPHLGTALIVTEHVVPPVRGTAVLERLRQDARLAGTPVLVWTTSVFPGTRTDVERLGGVYLSKPSTPTQVLDILHRLLDLSALPAA